VVGFDELRRARERLDDEELLAAAEERIESRMESAWKDMPEDERRATWDESWRASPDEYAARMKTIPRRRRDADVWVNPHASVREQIEAH
jgi:hypothetical protein